MRVAILTTETIHHAYYAHRLAEAGLLAGSILETRVATPPFDVAHPFEQRRDAYERETLLANSTRAVADAGPTLSAPSVNDPSAARALDAWSADLVVTFGTGLIDAPLIERLGARLLNLHGGDPERYRGLDTHLWAIYHRDAAGLVTTLHEVAPRLDAGAIVGQAALELPPDSELYQLRARNTERCVELTLDATRALAADGELARRPQEQLGRYYSAMPSVLKDTCVRRYRELAGSG